MQLVTWIERWRGIVAVACMAPMLWACDPQRISELEEGQSTEADVRAKFGAPEQVWDGSGGERIFEYNRQPEGHVNYMISIGTDGKMSALRQVLTPQNFAKVKPGMLMESVRKALGKPMSVVPYELTKEVHYNWRYMEAGTHQSMIFSVVVDRDLKVLRTESGPDMKSPQFKGG